MGAEPQKKLDSESSEPELSEFMLKAGAVPEKDQTTK